MNTEMNTEMIIMSNEMKYFEEKYSEELKNVDSKIISMKELLDTYNYTTYYTNYGREKRSPDSLMKIYLSINYGLISGVSFNDICLCFDLSIKQEITYHKFLKYNSEFLTKKEEDKIRIFICQMARLTLNYKKESNITVTNIENDTREYHIEEKKKYDKTSYFKYIFGSPYTYNSM
tara:strand:+ start:57 stop:584 length:528 start_codon:yes stop_codon:yes gene_type:complete